jgi:16S rRNA G966 N2-methylase RsmD
LIKAITSTEAQAFISTHELDSPHELALKYAQKVDFPIQLVVHQIKSRQKAKIKLPEWYQTKNIIFPHGVSMEQCSSEKTAKYKSELIQGESLIDLTGGTGVDTYYLSKKFEQTIYVERNKDLCELAKHNFSALGSEISIEIGEAASYIEKQESDIDWFYLDPARRDDTNKKVFKVSDCQPDLNTLLPLLLKTKANVLVKLSPMLDIKEVINTLTNIKSIHVVSVDNECKELLLLIENEYQGEIAINAVNIGNEKRDKFSFTYTEENNAAPKFSPPLEYLYEPNVSILKAGAFKTIVDNFSLFKIHRHSHLYTSEALNNNFQGRIFKIIAIVPATHKALKPYLNDRKANLTVRNFPLTTNQLGQKLKIKDGGKVFIFATTILQDKHRLIICEKVK